MLNELLCDPLGTLEKQNVVICALTRLSKQVRGQSKTMLKDISTRVANVVVDLVYLRTHSRDI